MRRIGLTQRVDECPERDERRESLDQAWTRLMVELECLPVPLPNQLPDALTAIGELRLEAIILTGGNDLGAVTGTSAGVPDRDRFERDLLEVCGCRRLPVFAVCRGMQMLVVHHGGRVGRLTGHVGVRHSIRTMDPGAMCLRDREEVNSFHQFGVLPSGVGPHLTAIAMGPGRSVEAVAHEELPQWGIMWHPERAPHEKRDRDLIRHFLDRFVK